MSEFSDKSPSPLPGVLTSVTSSNDTELSITYNIPIQTIYLRGYRIEMSSAANALSEKVLYLELPIYQSSKMIDNNPGVTLLPILLDNTAVSHTFGMDLPITMSHDLYPVFRMRILNSSFVPVSNLVHASFQFSLTKGSL